MASSSVALGAARRRSRVSLRYVLTRLSLLIPTWLGVEALAFALIHMIPGNVATTILGINATPLQQIRLEASLGLRKPLVTQFLDWVGHSLNLNLGTSLVNGTPVAQEIWQHLLPTVELVVYGMLLTVAAGIPLGVWTAVHKSKVVDEIINISTLGIASVPSFFVGSLVIIVASHVASGVQLIGYTPLTQNPVTNITTMFWPSAVLAVSILPVVVRFTRASMLSALSADYVVTAQSLGIPHRTVVYRNALRNALVPVISAVGSQVSYLVGGAVIIETVFTIPGIGMLTLNAIENRDYPVVQGVVLVIATGVILVNLVVDLLYAWADPQVTR